MQDWRLGLEKIEKNQVLCITRIRNPLISGSINKRLQLFKNFSRSIYAPIQCIKSTFER